MGMTFVSRWPGQESNTEIAFITGLAAEWAYEKNSVKDLLQEPFSSGPLGHRAGAIRTDGGPTQDRHGPHLPFRPGRPFYIQTGHSEATRVGIVGIAERQNVTAREQARLVVRSPAPFYRQILNPMETFSYRPPCSTLLSHHTLLLRALISALGFRSTPKGTGRTRKRVGAAVRYVMSPTLN